MNRAPKEVEEFFGMLDHIIVMVALGYIGCVIFPIVALVALILLILSK